MIKDHAERRRFFRLPYEKPICYRKLILAGRKTAGPKSCGCVSKNLSGSGILFSSKDLPTLSDIILLDLNVNEIPAYEMMKKDILTLNNRPVAKVVRTEEIGNNQYNVGVAFLTKSKNDATDIERLINNMKRRRYTAYLLATILILFTIAAVLFINLTYFKR